MGEQGARYWELGDGLVMDAAKLAHVLEALVDYFRQENPEKAATIVPGLNLRRYEGDELEGGPWFEAIARDESASSWSSVDFSAPWCLPDVIVGLVFLVRHEQRRRIARRS